MGKQPIVCTILVTTNEMKVIGANLRRYVELTDNGEDIEHLLNTKGADYLA